MTTQPLSEVTQTDREAAAAWLVEPQIGGARIETQRLARRMRSGEETPSNLLLQAFPRHRLNATADQAAEIQRLREACAPFLAAAQPIIHNDRERWHPDEWIKRTNALTVGDFRDLAAALNGKDGDQ